MQERRDYANLPPQELVAFVDTLLNRLQASGFSQSELSRLVVDAYHQTQNVDPQRMLPGSATAGGPLGPSAAPPVKYKLQLSHNCMAQGCLDEQCSMCRFNPLKACTTIFRVPPYAYTTDDPIVAKCQGSLQVSIQDSQGNALESCPADFREKRAIMVVALASQRHPSPELHEGASPPLSQMQEYVLTRPSSGRSLQPLLTADNAMTLAQICGGANLDFQQQYSNALCVPVNDASIYTFRNLRLRHSCEALMPGKSPRVRLMFMMLKTGPCTEDLEIQGVISSEFLVTTSRAKGRGDGGSLLYSSKVTFLPGVGLETERKLLTLAESCPNMASLVPQGGVQSVGQLGALLKELERKNDLRQHFKSVLKLDDLARWNKLLDAINAAVADDNRVRVYETKSSRADTDNLQLLFNAHQGQIVFEEKEPYGSGPPSIIGIIYRMAGASLVPTFVHVKDMTAQNLGHMHHLRMEARAKWFTKGHPGWSISHWSAPNTVRQGCLVEAHEGDMPLQLPPLFKDPHADNPVPRFHYVVAPKAQEQYVAHTQPAQHYPEGQTQAVRYQFMGNLN